MTRRRGFEIRFFTNVIRDADSDNFEKYDSIITKLIEDIKCFHKSEYNAMIESISTMLKAKNERIWESYLSRIKITDDENIMKTFYSCMYRVFLYPHKAYEIDKNGEAVHYSTTAGCVKKGFRYTDNGFWDTYRTVYPFFQLLPGKNIRKL